MRSEPSRPGDSTTTATDRIARSEASHPRNSPKRRPLEPENSQNPWPYVGFQVSASDLEGATHLVEGVAMESHDATGLRDVAQLLGELEQRELASSSLG